MKAAFQIEIPRRGHACIEGKEALAPGMVFYSVLLEDQSKQLIRKDYCEACWKKDAQNYWKGKVPEKIMTPATSPDRYEQALKLLKQALTRTDDDSINEAFILAVFLARRRHLFLRQEIQSEGRWVQLYEIPSTEEMLAVTKVDLSKLHIDKLQAEMAAKFAAPTL